jgi:hypothetical protein
MKKYGGSDKGTGKKKKEVQIRRFSSTVKRHP